MAFCAKDALLVVDDFAPGRQGDGNLLGTAERLCRGAGNQQGRSRLSANGSRTQGSLRPQLVPRRQGGNIGAVEAHWSIQVQKIHDRRWIRAVRQAQEMPNLVYRCREEFVGRECHSWVERDPALKRLRRGKLRACRLRRGEKPAWPVNNLNRAFPAVLGVPFHVEDIGPKAHGTSKGRGHSRFRCCEADTQTHVTGLG